MSLKSTASLPAYTLQSSMEYSPIGEISIRKEGKIHMKIWSDTLARCKKTGKTSFLLLPLLDNMETQLESRT